MSPTISAKDRNILRELAKKQLEYANSPANKETIRLWYLHNACKGERPMIHLEMGTFRREIIPKRQKCEGERARSVEDIILQSFTNHEAFADDKPVVDYYPVYERERLLPFGVVVETEHAESPNGGRQGYRFKYPIADLRDDFEIIKKSEFHIQPGEAERERDFVNDIIGDILPVKTVSHSFRIYPTFDMLRLMGTEQFFVALLEYPELVAKALDQLADDYIEYLRLLENKKMLHPTTSSELLTMGSFCFTEELDESTPVKAAGSWGHLNSQETVGVSPKTFAEIIAPSFNKLAAEFGLMSYGCCEPVHEIWDAVLSKWDNLRKLSIAPWCDEEIMGERLRGTNIIFHRKPSSNYLGVGTALDEDAFRAHVRKTVNAARGCTLEITQRDVYTINHDEAKARRYVEIIREEMANHS